MSKKWTQQYIPNPTGKIIVVTGANSGLELESTKAFAQKGATVVMAARNLQKGNKARQAILKAHLRAALDLMALDNASLASAHAFKAKYASWAFY